MQPATSDELNDLAIDEINAGNLPTALIHAQRAVDIDGSNIAYRETLARVRYRMGDLPGVIAIYEAIVHEQPQNLSALKRLSRLLLENWQFDKADLTIARALMLDPTDAILLSQRVLAKHELGNAEQARLAALAAENVHPDMLSLATDARLLLPMIYTDTASVLSCRQRYAMGLQELVTMLPTWQRNPQQVFSLERSNFLLAYQGGNDLPLQQAYSGLIAQLVQAAAPDLRQDLKLRFDAQRKLRIGFVSKWLYSSTAGNYFERWITQLDPGRFERYVYYTGQGEDELTTRVKLGCEHFTRLNLGPQANGRHILADELDVLIHLEVGMSTGSYLLAAMRLAPIQFAAWGHPVTTGSNTMDYFLSCEDMEPKDHQTHYSENVVLLNGIGVDIALPPAGKKIERSVLGLPADTHLYFCPQSLFKIHPDMDEILVKILEGDSRAVLVFFQAGSRAITNAFGSRLSGRLADAGLQAKGQIKFLPRLGGDVFRSALSLADVMLDTVHWSGGGTSLDAFAVDVPVVTLPGKFMRGRQTAAMLRLMGLESLIASNVDDYVAKAIELASNRGMNESVRETIAKRNSNVFGRAEASVEFADRIYGTVVARL